jgi:hypothetical protein
MTTYLARSRPLVYHKAIYGRFFVEGVFDGTFPG